MVIKTWVAGETLTASDLNTNFADVTTNTNIVTDTSPTPNKLLHVVLR